MMSEAQTFMTSRPIASLGSLSDRDTRVMDAVLDALSTDDVYAIDVRALRKMLWLRPWFAASSQES